MPPMPSLHGMPTPTPTLTPTPAPAPAPKSMPMPHARIPRSSYASQDAHANAHADPRPCHVAISPFRHAMLSSGPPPSHSFRRYTVSDECEISEEMLGDNCDEQLAVLYREVAPTPHHRTNRHTTTPPSHPYHLTTAPPHRQHYHEDDEARLICGGECFFDVRDKVRTNPTQFFQWAFYLYIFTKCSYLFMMPPTALLSSLRTPLARLRSVIHSCSLAGRPLDPDPRHEGRPSCGESSARHEWTEDQNQNHGYDHSHGHNHNLKPTPTPLLTCRSQPVPCTVFR